MRRVCVHRGWSVVIEGVSMEVRSIKVVGGGVIMETQEPMEFELGRC